MRGDGFDIPFTMGAYDKFTDFLYDMWYRSPVCWKILKYQSHFLVYCPSENLITVRNEVAKVMFLHLSVILFTGGLLQCMLGYHPPGTDTPPGGDTPLDHTPPGPGTPGPDTPRPGTPQTRHPPWTRCLPRTRHPPPDIPPKADTPSSRWLLLWTVRILLECILVFHRRQL